MNPWQLIDSQALVRTKALHARIDLSHSALGLHDLSWNEKSISGSLLRLTVAEGATANKEPSAAGMDRFIRDNDLVANFPQSESQPFTLQIYWRVAAEDTNVLVLDAIVSLQTSLLECYPKAILTTELAAAEARIVRSGEKNPVLAQRGLLSSEPAAVLLRDGECKWSYFEMTHPDDLGCWRIEGGNSITMSRELGGEFQEKGVIRRLRVRGAFMSSENDMEISRRLIAEFAESPLPLTA